MRQAAIVRSTPANQHKAYYSVIGQTDNWQWMRGELRQDRPVMDAFINDYWYVLPAEYFEKHQAPRPISVTRS